MGMLLALGLGNSLPNLAYCQEVVLDSVLISIKEAYEGLDNHTLSFKAYNYHDSGQDVISEAEFKIHTKAEDQFQFCWSETRSSFSAIYTYIGMTRHASGDSMRYCRNFSGRDSTSGVGLVGGVVARYSGTVSAAMPIVKLILGNEIGTKDLLAKYDDAHMLSDTLVGGQRMHRCVLTHDYETLAKTSGGVVQEEFSGGTNRLRVSLLLDSETFLIHSYSLQTKNLSDARSYRRNVSLLNLTHESYHAVGLDSCCSEK